MRAPVLTTPPTSPLHTHKTTGSLLTNGVLGILFTALFLVLRVYMKQYQLRLVRFFALGRGGKAVVRRRVVLRRLFLT